MTKVPDTHHLIKRGSVWYYARRTPEPLVAEVGSSWIRYSLRTQDKKEAIRRRELEDVKWSARLDKAVPPNEADAPVTWSNSGPLTGPGTSRLLREYVERMDRRADERLAKDPPGSENQRREMEKDAEIGLQMLRDPDDPRGDERVLLAAQKVLGGFSEAIADPLTYDQVRRALLELGNRKFARLRDDRTRSFFDPLFDPSLPPDVTFGELADQFIQLKEQEGSANRTSLKTLDKQRANVSLVRAIVGDTTIVSTISYDTCLDVRGLLARVPTNWTKLYKGLTLNEAIERAERKGVPTLSPTTQNQYLGTFKDLLDLAAKKRLISVNPAEGLRPLSRDTVPRQLKRNPFTPEQITAFFQSPFYAKCAISAEPFRSDEKDGWRFWLPLLSIWTGLRPREICQAYVEDVRCTENDTWYLDVVASEGDDDAPVRKTLKTPSSRRRIPIHQQLIRCGFLRFVEQKRHAGADRLFPTLKPNKFGDPAWYPLKRFNEVFLPGAIHLGDRQSFYSFRHSFRDALRRIEASGDVLQAVGWSQGKSVVSDHYGSQLGPDHLRKYIDQIEYPGLDLSHLWAKSEL